MQEGMFADIVGRIREKDPHFDADAYFFVREALDFTSRMLKKPVQGEHRHVTGQELLEGIRAYAVQEYGPMARTVLDSWGIARTEDFGTIVFHLVEAGILGKTERDQRDDFVDGYNFYDAFVKPFLPTTSRKKAATGRACPRKAARRSGQA